MDPLFNLRLALWARILAAVGAINWGIVGMTGDNLVTLLFGRWPLMVQVIYILIGVSGLSLLFVPRRRLLP